MTKNPIQLLFRNIFSNYAAMVIKMGTAFVLSPILVNTLGKDMYGAWALVFSVIAYMNFLDFGMKQSLARYFPKYYALKDYAKLNEVFNAGNFLYSIAGVLTIIAAFIITFFFADSFKIPPELMPVFKALLIMIGFNQAFSFFMMTGTAIGPFHRYDISNVIEVLRTIGNTLVIIYFVKAGYGLIALGVITLATNLVNSTARRYAQHKIVPELKYSIKTIKKERINELLSYSVYSFLIVVGFLILFNASNVIIGAFISLKAVTIYSIAATLLNYLRTVVSSIGIPLVPAISHLDASSDTDEIAKLTQKLLRYLFYITSAISVGTLFFGGEFIYLWMGEGFEETSKILYMLIIPAAIYLPQVMTNSVFLGTGKHKTLFYIIGAEALANIILSISLIKVWGLYGVAVGTMIPQFIIYSFVYPYYFHRMINSPLGPFYKSSSKSIGLAVLFTLPLCWLLKSTVTVNNWITLIIIIVSVIAVSGAGFWYLILEPSDRSRLLKMSKKEKN